MRECLRLRSVDLAIQWDVCQEVLAREGYFPNQPESHKKEISDMIVEGRGEKVGRIRPNVSTVVPDLPGELPDAYPIVAERRTPVTGSDQQHNLPFRYPRGLEVTTTLPILS